MPTLDQLYQVQNQGLTQYGPETITLQGREINNPWNFLPRTNFTGLNQTISGLNQLRDRVSSGVLFAQQADALANASRANQRNFAQAANRQGLSLPAILAQQRQTNRDTGAALAFAKRQAIIDSNAQNQSLLTQIANAQLGANQIQSTERNIDQSGQRDLIAQLLSGVG